MVTPLLIYRTAAMSEFISYLAANQPEWQRENASGPTFARVLTEPVVDGDLVVECAKERCYSLPECP